MNKNSKTTLVYFGSLKNSKYGTLRSIIALILVIINLVIISLFSQSFYKIIKERILGVIICIIALISAICVIVPKNDYDALKYGASIGAVISIFVIVAYSKNLNWNSLIFFSLSILFISLISLIVYKLSKYLKLYPYQPCK